MMTEPTRYMVANGFTQFNQGVYHDVSPYSSMDGENINNEDEFPQSDEMMLEFSNASGKKKKKKSSGRSRRRGGMRDRMEARRKARQDRKNRKLAIKEKEAETQRATAEALSKTDPAEAKLMEQLASGDADKKATENTGMSRGLKIGLIVGGIVVAGVITIVVIRKMRAKKGK
jgi:cobalamin biosynthesis Mg chelatase CobN